MLKMLKKFAILLIICNIFYFSCNSEIKKEKDSVFCKNDSNCKDLSMICSSGLCVKPDCFSNNECSLDKFCAEGKCLRKICTNDSECPGLSICLNGGCSYLKEKCDNSVCSENFFCAYDGRCYQIDEKIPCIKHLDCPKGICLNGFCEDKKCELINDCPDYAFCKDSVCQPIECTAECENRALCINFLCSQNYSCKSGKECKETNLCFDGSCLFSCAKSAECPGISVCIENLCRIKRCETNIDCGDGVCVENLCVKEIF